MDGKASEGMESPVRARLSVLASGSGGNCSVLLIERPSVWGMDSGGGQSEPADGPGAGSSGWDDSRGAGTGARVCLIDLGLSPRRTVGMLAELGLRPDQVDDVLLTHFDSDHLHSGWVGALGGKSGGRRAFGPRTRVHVHACHARRAERFGLAGGGPDGGARVYDEAVRLHPGVTAHPMVMAHDDEGVVAFRFDFEGVRGGNGERRAEGSLGFATDLGRVTPELVRHLRGVNVLAIESNYCPERQRWSGRPEALQRRIMGGSGHLSNEEALAAISAIGSPEHVVLLHLSRECNCPEQVRGMHEGADYALTISSQFEPTRWVRVAPSLCPVSIRRTLRAEQPLLWGEPKGVAARVAEGA